MEEDLNKLKFGVIVSYNHDVLVSYRKEIKIFSSLLTFLSTLIFACLTVLSALGKNSAIWVPIVFGAFALYSFICTLYLLFTTKASVKDAKRKLRFEFYEDSLVIYDSRRKKSKKLENCLYRYNKNKQYIYRIIEYDNRFSIKILVGSLRGINRYRLHVLPKAIFKDEELTRFIEFIKEKVGEYYFSN